VADSYIEFDYQGRDSNRFVVAFLVDLARLVVEAEGEVCCQTQNDGSDPSFEFFTIRGGMLLRQPARLVREGTEIVS
jgi:hypothetical protein